MADDPPYLTVGTEVSAKYKGAFCEAKIRKVVRVVKCKVTFKAGNGSALLTDDQIKGTLRVGANVEAKHPDKNQFIEATINKIQDSSQYTVVFDDGDITTLRRSALCLKSGRHFNESETLDQLPLTHPEHFSNPVVGGRRGARRRAADKDDSSEEEEEEEELPPKKDGRKKYEKELDMGKVVIVEQEKKKSSKDPLWFPGLVVHPSASETVKIRAKDEYIVRSFRDGRYYTVQKHNVKEFTKESASKRPDSNSNVLKTAVEKALSYLEKNELPPHWDKDVLFGNVRQSESEDDDQQSESEIEDDSRNEEKDRFIAQLYKFMDDRSTPLNKVPQVCSRELDLHKLFIIVTGKGGYTKVTNQGHWKVVTIKIGYGNMPSTSTINLVKQAYKKFLFNFEEFYRKLGCTWTPRSHVTSSKSRSSRSIFRERGTPSSSSRESAARDRKGGDDDDGRSTPSSTKGKDKSDKDEKEKVLLSSPEADSPAPGAGDTGSESSDVKPKADPPEEIRKSARGRQPKKDRDAEESASPSASSRKKRQTTASRDRDRDSSVASSTKEETASQPPTTPSTNKDKDKEATPKPIETTPTGKVKQVGIGRGKWKRQGKASAAVVVAAAAEAEEKREQTPSKEEEKEKVERITTPAVTSKNTSIEIRLGDKLQVYYPKSEGKTYEAKVIEINDTKGSFLVHYTGWNNRYDEWIDRARVSQNTTLKKEQSVEEKAALSVPPAASSKSEAASVKSAQGPGVAGAKQRKGRNSSSATSTTSASSGTTPSAVTTTATTPSSTRSGASKIAAAASSSSPVSGKRRRSTSAEVVQPPPATKRRRTRQKSGQDTAVDSDLETSDSDGRSIKSEKHSSVDTVDSAKKTPVSRKEATTPTPGPPSDSKPSGKKGMAALASAGEEKSATKAEKGKSTVSQQAIPMDVDDDVPPSTKSKHTSKPTVPVSTAEDSKESNSNSSTSTTGQVIDLDQIRSEMKGLDKMVKGATTPTGSSPAPPTLSAAGGNSAEQKKLDIYEFEEDGADEAATPIPPTAPKLKMFSPVARTSTSPAAATAATATSSDKSPVVVSSSSAELVAKLGTSQDSQDKVPVVTIEKLEKENKEKEKEDKKSKKADTKESESSTKDSSKAPNPVPVTQAQTPTAPASTKEIKTSSAKIPPQITSFITTPMHLLSGPPLPTTTATFSLQSTSVPPLTISNLSTPTAVITSSLSAAPSTIIPLTTAPTLPQVILASNPWGEGASPITLSSITPIKGKKETLLSKSTVPVTATILGNPPRIVSVMSATGPQTSTASPSSLLLSSSGAAANVPPPIPLAVATPKVVATISSSAVTTTAKGNLSSISSPPPPSLLLQPQLPRPVFTITSPVTSSMTMTPSPMSTPERPLLTPQIVSSVVGSSVLSQQDPSLTASIPTISIIAAKPSTAETSSTTESILASSITSSGLPPPPPVQQQPLKIAATIPPPPPIVVKPPLKSNFGPSTIGPGGIDTPKQKKKKAKSSLSGQMGAPTPVKTLAPLPTVGAPPPPPVNITMMTTATTMTSTTTTPTPGRKTPVKKRIPPPMESPGKPVKPFSIHGGLAAPPTKPGKMNQEAMNAAIANVGATTPPAAIAVPTTVITPTSTIFQQQQHPHTAAGYMLASAMGTQPPPPPVVNIPSKNILPVTIKSSAESIAASIAAVASMGSSMTPKATLTSISSTGKSAMPMKRFMKDNSSSVADKMSPMNKDKVFTISSVPMSTQPMSNQPSQPPAIVIGKSMPGSDSSSQQQSFHPLPPPITIQAKFQSAPHTLAGSGPGLPTGPPVTFVKTLGTPSGNLMDQHSTASPNHPFHSQPNLPKNPPVIIIPAAPVVIKPAPFQQQPPPMIVPKPVQVDSHQQQSTPSSVFVTAASPSISAVKQPMLPITVTPSNIQNVGGNLQFTPAAVSSHHRSSLPAVELKPVISFSSTSALAPTSAAPTADLPPTITVTKATTVMKSISPDIVSVSSYNSMRASSTSSTAFTPLKQEDRTHANKEPEIVVKPAPASAQIVFHTTAAADSKKGRDSIDTHQPSHTALLLPKIEVKVPDENSLLCEEIIPGSPTAGDPEDKSDDNEKESKKDKNKAESTVVSSTAAEKGSPRSSSGGTTPRSATGSGKPVIVLGPKSGEDSLDDDNRSGGFILDERRGSKFELDELDDEDNKLMEERSVDSPMGPPSEGREADLPFRDSFSDGEGGDHSPPLSPSTSSSISSDDDSSRQHDTSRLSPTPEGGSSKSKDSDDDDMDSDVCSKSTHLDDADSKHGSTRGSTRIRNQSSRMGRSPSPPLSKRRRIMRRTKSPDDGSGHRISRVIRSSSGRKITPVGRHGGDYYMEEKKEVKQPPPPPPVNLAKPPKTGKYNFIPNLTDVDDAEQRITIISQCINDLKEQYQKTKTEAASFDRRVKRWKRRIREKERLARQEATRAAS